MWTDIPMLRDDADDEEALRAATHLFALAALAWHVFPAEHVLDFVDEVATVCLSHRKGGAHGSLS